MDSSGRLHLLFLDTRNTAQDDTASNAFLDAYYAWSEDGGDSWTQHRLTPSSFDTGSASFFLGDYMGMGVGHDHVYPIYPEVSGGVHKIMSNYIVWQEAAAIFADGFESSNTSEWSATLP